MRRLAFVCLAVGIAMAAAIVAGEPSREVPMGTVTGTIQEHSGRPLPGALVALRSLSGRERTMLTGADGRFVLTRIPTGGWTLIVSAVGFLPHTQPLQVGTVRITLAPIRLRTRMASLEVEATSPSDKAVLRAVSSQAPAGAFWPAPMPMTSPPFNTEAYAHIDSRGFRRVADAPLSTFSVDVDTASYANVRRILNDGRLPPRDAVRIEELLNYFPFDYQAPATDAPFSITTQTSACPWQPDHQLVLIGLQAHAPHAERRATRNLVFLIDVSGSMIPPDKLPLIKSALPMLVDQLTASDRVAIVVYAGSSGLVLPSTSGDQKERIRQAIASLESGGSTNGGEGIQLAYRIAQEQFVKGGINRVILATDGDFNVGVTSEGDLVRLIEEQRRSGVFLSVLGVGTGNLKDSTMEKLAHHGNGNYAYLDSLQEARKVLVGEAGGTLITVAKDVKLQVEFNPARVGAYRLIGYENRQLRDEEFNDDRKDAGDVGAGHRVTALYEVVPKGREGNVAGSVDPLRYQTPARGSSAAGSDELMSIKVRYKAPDGDTSRLTTAIVRDTTTAISANLGFAAAVAAWGMVLRDDEHRGRASWELVLDLARKYRGNDEEGYRAEFIRLVELSRNLARQETPSTSDGFAGLRR